MSDQELLDLVADELARAVEVVRNPYSEDADRVEVAHLAAIHHDEYLKLRITAGSFSTASHLAYVRMFRTALCATHDQFAQGESQ